jgi:hypothetical protein
MRLRPCLTLLSLLVLPAGLAAQHWTPEEQEIIDLNQRCWEAWASKDLTRVGDICNEHPDARGWWTAYAAPDLGWYAANAHRWMDAVGSKEEWIYFEINPLSVRIFNDTALIHFWAVKTARGVDGTVKEAAQKQLNIWQRIDGKWTWIGGMASPSDG